MIKTMPRNFCKKGTGTNLVSIAPSPARTTEGKTKVKNIFFVRVPLNRNSLEILPKQCRSAVSAKTKVMLSKNTAAGTKNVEEPKPLIVPISSDKNPIKISAMS